MKEISEIANQIGTTKQQKNTSTENNHSREGMAKCWRALVAMRLQSEPVGSTDFLYWDAGLREFSDDDLVRGVRLARDFTGFLTLGAFRDMCRPEVIHQSHRVLSPTKRSSWNPEKRQETIRRWRQEIGL